MFSGVTTHPGLSGVFLFNIYPGIAINSMSFHAPECPIGTMDYMITVVITLTPPTPTQFEWESRAANQGLVTLCAFT